MIVAWPSGAILLAASRPTGNPPKHTRQIEDVCASKSACPDPRNSFRSTGSGTVTLLCWLHRRLEFYPQICELPCIMICTALCEAQHTMRNVVNETCGTKASAICSVRSPAVWSGSANGGAF